MKVLLKKGNPQLPDNYRPIAIIPMLYKLFSKILHARVKHILVAAQSVDQAGFRPGFSCDDHLFAVTLIADKLKEFHKPLWLVVVDFKKAFDSIEHGSLWDSLSEQKVPSAYIQCLQNLYTDQRAYVDTDKKSKHLHIGRGTKQGDPISPSLFNATLEKCMRAAKARWVRKKWGISVGYGEEGQLTNLRFADDIMLLGRSLSQVKEMLADLVREAGKVGLEIHPDKTKIMNNGIGIHQNVCEVEVAGRTIEILPRDQSAMYLGRLLNLGSLHDTELDHRLRRAWAKFGAFKQQLLDPDYSLFQRLRLFQATVTPTALYGSCSWSMTQAREHTLRTAQRKMLRAILGRGRRRIEKSDDSSHSSLPSEPFQPGEEDEVHLESWVEWKQRTTNHVLHILNKLKMLEWPEEQRRRQWRWAGEVARRQDGRWTKRVLHWVPDGQRRRGRPATRWDGRLIEYFKGSENWWKVAKDRVHWNDLEPGFVFGEPERAS